MSTEIYCRFTINRLPYHTTGWLLLDNNIIFLHCGYKSSRLLDGLYVGNNDGTGRKRMIQNDKLEIQEVDGSGAVIEGVRCMYIKWEGKMDGSNLVPSRTRFCYTESVTNFNFQSELVAASNNDYLYIIILFKENLSGFFPWDLPGVKIFPERVTGPEQGRIATFSLWTGMFSDTLGQITKQKHKLQKS